MTEKEIKAELKRLAKLVKKDNEIYARNKTEWSADITQKWSLPLVDLAQNTGKKRVIEWDKTYDRVLKIGVGDIVVEV